MYSYRPHDWLAGSRAFNPVQVSLKSLEAVSKGVGPMKPVLRLQAENFTQATRFGQASLDYATRVSQSRTPQDVFAANAALLHTASEHYHEAASRMLQLWAEMLVPVVGTAAIPSKPAASMPVRMAKPRAPVQPAQRAEYAEREREAA
jgi:hypothetical protein